MTPDPISFFSSSVQDAEGGWRIIDYKTNRLADTEEKTRTIERYRQQMGLYALAFWKLFGQRPSKTSLYFTTIAEEVVMEWSEEDLRRVSDELDETYRRVVVGESA